MRKVRRTLLVLALAVVAMPVSRPASATAVDLTCTANAQVNFTPPLIGSTTEADADVTGGLVNCSSPNGAYSNLLSATITGTGTATAEPGILCALLLTIEGTATLSWSPSGPPNSRLDFLLDTNPLAGTVTISATITNGPLTDDSLEPVPVEVNPNLDCATQGLKNITSILFEAVFNLPLRSVIHRTHNRHSASD